jgi:HK97 family phage major capsid protein
MEHLEKKLNEILGALDAQKKKSDEEVKQHGTMLEETKSSLAKLQQQLDAVDLKLVEHNRNSPVARKSIAENMKENEDIQRLFRNKKGSAVLTLSPDQADDVMFGQKTTILSGGAGFNSAAGGVVGVERIPTLVPEARRRLRMRDVLTARPTQSPLIYYVKVSTPFTSASPQVEGSAKYENAVQFTAVSTNVITLATWIPASKQILDDLPELESFIRSSLPYYVNKAEDQQILSGDGTGQNLNGLITQGSAFNASLLSAAAGYTRIDMIGAAAEQVDIIDEVPSSFVAVNPRDAWNLRRTKDGFGRYLLGDPQSEDPFKIWGLTVISTTAMAAGTFLVGTGDEAAAQLRDRMEMQVEISTEHQDYFVKNLVAIRAEKRVALVVQRPQAFITGTFSTSPAGL